VTTQIQDRVHKAFRACIGRPCRIRTNTVPGDAFARCIFNRQPGLEARYQTKPVRGELRLGPAVRVR
jgi:hypothetical protein